MGLESFVKTAQSTINSVLGGGLSGGSGSMEPLTQVYNTDWGNASLFELNINCPYLSAMDEKTDNIFSNRDNFALINASILSVQTATIAEAPIEEWIEGRWVYTHGRPELRQVTFTFRDTSNGWLYRNFNGAKNWLRNQYPDEQEWELNLKMYGTYTGWDYNFGDGRLMDSKKYKSSDYDNYGTILQTSKAVLESISSMTFDQGDHDNFLTFSVTFKYMNIYHNTDFKDGTKGIAKTPIDDIY